MKEHQSRPVSTVRVIDWIALIDLVILSVAVSALAAGISIP